jgi:hypothetical protein
MPERIFMRLGMYIIAPGSISTAYFINPSQQSVCLYVCPPIVARQRLGAHVPMAINMHKRVKLFEASFSIRFVSYQRTLYRSVCVSTKVARQRFGKQVPAATKNYWKLRFYAVCVVPKESRRSVLTRTSCLYMYQIIKFPFNMVHPLKTTLCHGNTLGFYQHVTNKRK